MKTYLEALQDVLKNGHVRKDRTGTGTISIFGMQQRYNLRKSFPAVTTKKLAWRACVSELLWFIEGSGDERRLSEILHGTRDTDKKTIWTANAEADYWQPKAKFDGDLGRVYGVQWRDWRTPVSLVKKNFKGIEYTQAKNSVDQLANLIQGIKQDPTSRRHILSAWNPGELDQMALPPCHAFAQFYVADGELSCQMYQRSCDMFLGVPFNIASYSLFTCMLAQVCGLKPGDLVHTLGDAHIYSDHVDQVKTQLGREPLLAPTLWLNPDVTDINDFTMDDIRLDEYTSYPAITAKMAV
jgi:thymidylate synthase